MKKKALRLYDNTVLTAYKRCPRFYLYRHVFDWATEGVRAPLVFGGAWHAAMDVVWPALSADPKVNKEELATRAHDAFLRHWIEEGMPPPADIDYEMEKEMAPRTPGQALEMIIAYIHKRAPMAGDFELIQCEKPFAVPLDPDDDTLFYVGKIDKVVRRSEKIMGIEHKTTTAYRKDGGFRSNFLESFSPNSQVDGYLYALHFLFPGEKMGGVWVDAALVHKQEEAFKFIPIERQLQHLDTWLWEVQWWIGQIEEQKRIMVEECTPQDTYLKAFPKNTNSCFDFAAACPYLVPCKSWPNPLGFEIPPGYAVNKWNPLEHVKGLEELDV